MRCVVAYCGDDLAIVAKTDGQYRKRLHECASYIHFNILIEWPFEIPAVGRANDAASMRNVAKCTRDDVKSRHDDVMDG